MLQALVSRGQQDSSKWQALAQSLQISKSKALQLQQAMKTNHGAIYKALHDRSMEPASRIALLKKLMQQRDTAVYAILNPEEWERLKAHLAEVKQKRSETEQQKP